MVKMKITMLVLLAAALVLTSGCIQQTAGTGDEIVKSQGEAQLNPAEQEDQAYDIFKEILELSSGPEREKNIPRMKELYREIIETYPDSGLAQESYLRLILIAKEEKSAAGDAEAERLYQEYSGKYPDSSFGRILKNEARATD